MRLQHVPYVVLRGSPIAIPIARGQRLVAVKEDSPRLFRPVPLRPLIHKVCSKPVVDLSLTATGGSLVAWVIAVRKAPRSVALAGGALLASPVDKNKRRIAVLRGALL